ncbi:rod shape-determining protein [Streptomyces sp. ODS28]|uniref:rod shape-determining protein n=1 Tax=Streptomyces sp. ODS28 TaxID=3136688 RepID=UPI0031E9832B
MTYRLDQLSRCSVAVDLGSARTRIHIKGTGLIVDEPSAVAVNTFSGALMAVGTNAERMDGRTPEHINVVRPINDGTVIDIDMAQRMLRAFLGSTLRGAWRRRGPIMRAAVTIPYNAGPLSRRAAVETLTGVGARRVELVEAPTAAGIGAGLPVGQPEAAMVLVCGATTTQIAVLSLGSVVSASSVPLGGDTVRHAVAQHLRNEHELLLPSQNVQPLYLALTGNPLPDPETGMGATEVFGRDVSTGLGRTVTVDPEHVRSAIHPNMTGLSDAIRSVLHRCPPDLVADLADSGMTLSGGSAQLPGLAEMLHASTGMEVHVAEQPALAAVNGLAAMVEGKAEPLRIDVP